jgi:hypothetical protein
MIKLQNASYVTEDSRFIPQARSALNLLRRGQRRLYYRCFPATILASGQLKMRSSDRQAVAML